MSIFTVIGYNNRITINDIRNWSLVPHIKLEIIQVSLMISRDTKKLMWVKLPLQNKLNFICRTKTVLSGQGIFKAALFGFYFNMGKDVQQQETSFMADGNAQWYHHTGTQG